MRTLLQFKSGDWNVNENKQNVRYIYLSRARDTNEYAGMREGTNH